MFDPVSLIVIALTKAIIAGAMEAGKQVGKEAGSDAYRALKAYLVNRYGPQAAAGIANLEREPGRRQQDDLARLLRATGASRDPQLLALAQQLFDLVEDGLDPDPLEEPKRKAGVRAVGQILDHHIQWISDVRDRISAPEGQFLSSEVASAPNIPAEVKDQIALLHGRIRGVIEQVAANIENGKYTEVEGVARDLPSLSQRERAARLVQADKAIHVSYSSLNLTVGFFSDLNEIMLARIEQERSSHRQTQMMFGNAIMIYEMADFVIGFISGFTLGGVAELDALHQETLDQIVRLREDNERLSEQAKHPDIDPATRESTLEAVRQRAESLDLLRHEWDRYVADTREFYERVEEARNKVRSLELIRDNARVQLTMLELVAMLRFLRQNADAVRATVQSLQGFRLAPLSPARVRRLIGS